ncbi:LysR family transcriptional regulator [Noviherbaspirillum sedimenti]|uniref:LysR family transcriptional regulator n=1 Tax=Noviherbaspirillum sedimenti TaxID=2320865 RepID=A0A3A3G0D6_9BURK|nr:LysR family transcriptional regulator [Noviherbaspirillum sedimenti]RJG01907.1 LysR family transcriptional regulator [Noviherbaspirillum sedimenti]
MDINKLDLNLLRVFDAVYRERSLSRAASRLGISQPGISQALNRLRQNTGDPLFVRQTHGVAATSYSDAIAQPIQRALEGLQEALQAQTALDIRQTDRRLRIAMSDYSESLILAPLIRMVDEQAPKLQIRVVPDDRVNLHTAMNDGELDLIIGAIPPLNEQYRHQDLCTEEFVCIVRRGHPTIQGQLSLEQYKQARHVGLAVRAAQLSKIDQACQPHGFQRQIHVVVPNFLALPFIIAATDGVATMPRRLLRLVPPHLGLQVLAPPLALPTPTVRQYWPERNHQDMVCRWIREQIHKICQAI